MLGISVDVVALGIGGCNEFLKFPSLLVLKCGVVMYSMRYDTRSFPSFLPFPGAAADSPLLMP